MVQAFRQVDFAHCSLVDRRAPSEHKRQLQRPDARVSTAPSNKPASLYAFNTSETLSTEHSPKRIVYTIKNLKSMPNTLPRAPKAEVAEYLSWAYGEDGFVTVNKSITGILAGRPH